MRKFRLLIGHNNDQFFVQEKSPINKRFEIISVHYSEVKAQEALSYLVKTANRE